MSDVFNSESLTEEQRNELAQAVAIFEEARKTFRNTSAFLDRNALNRVMLDLMAYPFSETLNIKKKSTAENELFFLAISVYNAKQIMHKYVPKEKVEDAIVKETLEQINETNKQLTKETENVEQQTMD